MFLTLLKAKIHAATVTSCDLHYEGSVSIDAALLEAAGILAHERVEVWNITNGARISTYAITAPAGSGMIGINGAGARHFLTGDTIIIAAFALMDQDQALRHTPTVILVDEANNRR